MEQRKRDRQIDNFTDKQRERKRMRAQEKAREYVYMEIEKNDANVTLCNFDA